VATGGQFVWVAVRVCMYVCINVHVAFREIMAIRDDAVSAVDLFCSVKLGYSAGLINCGANCADWCRRL
jgi:hypothetical protein